MSSKQRKQLFLALLSFHPLLCLCSRLHSCVHNFRCFIIIIIIALLLRSMTTAAAVAASSAFSVLTACLPALSRRSAYNKLEMEDFFFARQPAGIEQQQTRNSTLVVVIMTRKLESRDTACMRTSSLLLFNLFFPLFFKYICADVCVRVLEQHSCLSINMN